MTRFVIDLSVTSKYSMNEIYSGKHWSVRKKTADEIHELTQWCMIMSLVKKELYKKPVVVTISYDSRLDIDNHGWLSKMIIDAMKDYILKDDTKKYVKELRQKFWNGDGILVEVEEC